MSSDDRHPVEALGEEYLARRRRGEIATIEQYAQDHPEYADEIRELFPAMEALESLKSASGSGFTQFDDETLEQLGDFRVIGEIGRGGMGVVYEVEQKTLGRRVALKVLPRQMVADAARRERFEREAQTAAGLHHTNIVPIFGVGEADGHHFYVMQLIRGVGLDRILAELRGESKSRASSSLTESMLSDVVSQLHDVTSISGDGQPGPPRAVGPRARATLSNRYYYRSLARIGMQIADALDYAHAAGTLHRDIKPANLLLDATGTAWITDFGLAKALEQSELTRSGDVIGTLRYMAPEQMRGQFDRRSDIFSLGLTLYELATLQPAFQGRDRAELVRQITEGQIARVRKVNPHCPRDLATIIEKACATEPRDRYATAGDLSADLQRFLEDRPIEARRVSTLESVWRWCRRNRALASAAAIALLALVTAGVTGWIGWVTTRDALADARDANELADANLRLSLDAFGTMFDEVCGDDALAMIEDRATDADYTPATSRPPSPDTLPLLQHILDFYDRFAERNADNELLAWEIATAHRRMGEIRFRLGRFEEAIASFEEAIR
ncbi:MAG: protein kinase, partial [Planctomycetes bacterium]|nr:protein kinase [Planctomycetota bacterium]